MSHSCCTTDTTPARQATCPANGQPYKQVPLRTVTHHIKKPWQYDLDNRTHYFCDDPDCDVVYFDNEQHTYNRNAVRTNVGQKSVQAGRTLCYCFDVTAEDLKKEFETRKSYVTEKTKHKQCDCELSNPSGKCCLKNFTK